MAEQQIISAVASSSNSSSTVSRKKYDVFLSFRGEDTRVNFTSHLYEALKQKGVKTYIDEQLVKGDKISEELTKAIEDSHISVVILSKNYASSKWCLEELSKILECRKSQGQCVKPIFYNIDPADVRKQTGSYKTAFENHVGDPRCNKWKAALTEVANLAGWDSRNRTESELLKDIVGDILRELTSSCQNQLKGFVGIEQNLEQIESLLKIRSGGVKTIGIWGMGGIGKTTLAKALYAKLSPEFEGSCFLENVRENLDKLGLKALRTELFSQLLEQKNLAPVLVSNFDKRRLGQKKVLIVLDDVTTFKKLEDLIEDFDLLGPGSRVIVTSRNKEIFSQEVEVFEIKKLSFYHSFELFCLTAFEGKQPKQGYEYLSRSAISCCSGVPLALKVLGAGLRQRSKEAWESELRKLEKIPNREIHEILKLSYDALDDSQQNVLLDIACFFKGMRRDWVTTLLEACGSFAASAIEVLLDKALITISDLGCIEMHDLIQDMGREIVRQESIEDPGKRSRLWKHEEVCEVLKDNTGTGVVQSIALDLCELTGDLELDSDSFTTMTKLRFLKIHDGYLQKKKFNVCFPRKGLTSLSNKLRYLHWDRCSLESLPSNFCAEHLVELHMRDSKLKKLWDGVQNLVNLKVIDLSNSRELTEIPDLSKAEKLETVMLGGCENLSRTTIESFAANIKFLPLLKILYLSGCSKLVSLPELPPSLSRLWLEGCDKLVSLLELPPSMHYPTLHGCSKLVDMAELPLSLSDLWLESCSKLVSLPKLPPSLSHLSLTDCNKLVSLPELPPSLGILSLKDCSKLVSLPKLPPSLSVLKGCGKLVSLPELPPSLSNLLLEGCSKLVSLPELPPSLRYLWLFGCSKLVSLPELPPSLSHLRLEDCSKLVSLPKLPASLEVLRTINCTSLDTDFTQQLLLQHMLHSGPLSHQESQYNYFILGGEHVTDKCEFRTAGSSIAIPSLPLSHPESHLHVFICYIIISSTGLFDVFYSIYQHGEKVGWGHKQIIETNLISEHVVLFHVKCKRSHVFRNDLPFEFKFDIHDQAKRIRECGVFPVYALESGGLKLFDRSSKQILDSESISQMSDNESQRLAHLGKRRGRLSPEWQAKRKKAKELQSQNTCPHILSRGGYSVLEEKIIMEKQK